jgi:GDP-L-fucose synthase
MNINSKIYVAGHKGMVGSAIVRFLTQEGFSNLILKTSAELDLCDQKATAEFFEQEKPEYVFLAAAKVGGILANKQSKADFIYKNIMIQTNVIHYAHLNNVKKLLFLGSSCIYPKEAISPITENLLMTGAIEETNDAYAIAKIAGIHMCRAYHEQHKFPYVALMPCNLYGPGDNFDPLTSHVMAALVKKVADAKQNNLSEIEVWGTGTPRREFLHVDDVARASIFLMQNSEHNGLYNVGAGTDVSIKELLQLIFDVTNFEGTISHDLSRPDGTMQKLMDSSKLRALGWHPEITLREGVKELYRVYCDKNGITPNIKKP